MKENIEDIVKHEKEIINKVKQGDVIAFGDLYKKESPKLYKNILRIVKQEAIAEEILQDVFTKFWEKKESINIEISIKSYLYRIAHNLIMDMFRKAAFDKKLLSNLISISIENYSNTEDLTNLKITQKILEDAIYELPPQRRKIYLLVKFEGKSYKEVSEMLNISTSTISDHVVKATKIIKKQFDNNDFVIIMTAIALTAKNFIETSSIIY
jgi:RNA polymerase sigma-70 factor (family 1)